METKNFSTEIDIRDAVTRYFSIGDYSKGDALLAEVSDRISDYIKLECLGNRFFYKRDFQNAVRSFEEGITLMPDHIVPRYQYLVGIQLEKQGNLVDAFKRYQLSIESDPTFIDAYVELGGLLTKVKDYAGALRCYRDAFKLDESDATVVFNLKAVLEELVSSGESEYQLELESVKKLSENFTPPNVEARW